MSDDPIYTSHWYTPPPPFNTFPVTMGEVISGPPLPNDLTSLKDLKKKHAGKMHEIANILLNPPKRITFKEANFLAITLSQKIENKLIQKLTTEEFNEFKAIIMTAHRRAAKKTLHPMLASAWAVSLGNSRFVPETPEVAVKLEKFIDFLLSVNLKEQLTNKEKEKLTTALKDTVQHHSWLKNKVEDIIDRLQ